MMHELKCNETGTAVVDPETETGITGETHAADP
jgi:hypothetical protein